MVTINHEGGPEQRITVELPAKYWLVVTVAIQKAIAVYVKPATDELIARGIDPSTIPEDLATALRGPVASLEAINKAMHAAGQDVGDDFSLDAMMRSFHEDERRRPKQ